MFRMSRRFGTSESAISPSVNSAAAINGSDAFFDPLIVIVP